MPLHDEAARTYFASGVLLHRRTDDSDVGVISPDNAPANDPRIKVKLTFDSILSMLKGKRIETLVICFTRITNVNYLLESLAHVRGLKTLWFIKCDFDHTGSVRTGLRFQALEQLVFDRTRGDPTPLIDVALSSATVNDLGFMQMDVPYKLSLAFLRPEGKKLKRLFFQQCSDAGKIAHVVDVVLRITSVSELAFYQCPIGVSEFEKMFLNYGETVLPFQRERLKSMDSELLETHDRRDLESLLDMMAIGGGNMDKWLKPSVAELTSIALVGCTIWPGVTDTIFVFLLYVSAHFNRLSTIDFSLNPMTPEALTWLVERAPPSLDILALQNAGLDEGETFTNFLKRGVGKFPKLSALILSNHPGWSSLVNKWNGYDEELVKSFLEGKATNFFLSLPGPEGDLEELRGERFPIPPALIPPAPRMMEDMDSI